MRLSIIIPCYNEERRIGRTLQRIADYMSEQDYEYEVIVLDNGSIDCTVQMVEGFKSIISNLRIISARSHGKGWAIKEGMLNAQGDYRLFTDADNSTDISQIEKMFGAIEEGYDVVISSRKTIGAEVNNQTFIRRITSALFSKIVHFIVPLEVKDTQNGFKLFTKRAALKIFPQQTMFYWAFDVEILALAQTFGFKVKEVPVIYINDEDSKMSLKGMAHILLEVVLIRINLWTQTYIKNERRRVERRKLPRDEEKEDRRKL